MKMRMIVLTVSDKLNDKYKRIPENMKEGGYCVAGIMVDGDGKWKRLIGCHDSFKITNAEARYANGELCRPFDVIEVECVEMDHALWAMGMAHGWGGRRDPFIVFKDYPDDLLGIQPENNIALNKFRFVGRVSPAEFFASNSVFYDEPYIFLNGQSRLDPLDAKKNAHSLALVKVENLILEPEMAPVSTDKPDSEIRYKNHYKAMFNYNGVTYTRITVTDPEYDAPKYDYQTLELGDRVIVVSLGGIFQGWHYKLIASIFDEYYPVEAGKPVVDYPYERDLVITNCIRKMLKILGSEGIPIVPVRTRLFQKLEKMGYIFRDHGMKPTALGIQHGLFMADSINSMGEPFHGLFFGKEAQIMLFSLIPSVLKELEEEGIIKG